MDQWLHGAVEDETDAQARREEHGDPGRGGVVGFAVIRAQRDPAGGGQADDEHEDRDGHDQGAEEPREVFHHPSLHGGSHLVDAGGGDDRPDEDGQGERQRHSEDDLVGGEFRPGVRDVDAGHECRVDGPFTAGCFLQCARYASFGGTWGGHVSILRL